MSSSKKSKALKTGCDSTAMLILAGACVGGATMMAYSMFRLEKNDVTVMFSDPPAPNTEAQLPFIAEELYNITKEMPKLVPAKDLEKFKKLMRSCIKIAEKIASVKAKIEQSEDASKFRDKIHKCMAYAEDVYEKARQANELFFGDSADLMSEKIDVVTSLLTDAIQDMVSQINTTYM